MKELSEKLRYKGNFLCYTQLMKSRKFKLILLFLFTMAFLAAQMHGPRALPHGRGMGMNPGRRPIFPENISLIGVKVEDSGKDLTLSLYFNGPVDGNSFNGPDIFIKDNPLSEETEFLFNKNRHMARFSIPPQEGEFSLRLTKISSFDRKPLPPVELKNLEANTFLKYSREEQSWEKSSL